ncbi:biotin/lipoyl-containing protein [Pseudoflavonifractor capillosus]|uniref:Biotin carboxyl carrier protein of acetyl-CoA carboxylase n=1 Tax=Pseudoflavonifractor capillosus TaxID=106588 RepID=A0A921MKQ0_9FIRM|nr:biotin/lipoyl-containing protein [Pseudoflavonifractor capillosus]HJG86279.1 acetyl-CoA carboxylase biotin carboxyl carrier protein subunit [Pseudoflavonifractor capillosus]
MSNQDVFELMARFEGSAAVSMKFTCKDFSLELSKAAGTVPAAAPVAAAPAVSAAPAAVEEEGSVITAPLVGTYYAAPSPGAAPFVSVGDQVKKGQTVCLMEAMKMMNEVTAPCDCVIEALLQEDGALVSFGAPLLRYKAV